MDCLDSIRQWKTRIDTATRRNQFAVGLPLWNRPLRGKSSLVRAGVLRASHTKCASFTSRRRRTTRRATCATVFEQQFFGSAARGNLARTGLRSGRSGAGPRRRKLLLVIGPV